VPVEIVKQTAEPIVAKHRKAGAARAGAAPTAKKKG
jgi:hypothetical protein